MNKTFQVGMIGLGTMGSNLVLNLNDKGYRVAGYDKDATKVAVMNKLVKDDTLAAFENIGDFVTALVPPRLVMLLVPAGKIVDYVIGDLKPLLAKGDLIIDCGNSHFTDTTARIKSLDDLGFHFMGVGISGGETGARFGPSIMPGGDKEAYRHLAPMLEAIAAQVNEEPCTAYMGHGAAGHYVKMVHNGIEYALMQLLAETYHMLKKNGYTNEQLHNLFDKWNKGRLQGYLVEITAAIFQQKDGDTPDYLVDKILDTAHQKGTGAWMSQDAMNVQSPIPVIDAAVSQRILSALKAERVAASKKISLPAPSAVSTNDIEKIAEEALYAGYIISYAQGMAMMQQASTFYKFETNIRDVAAIWRGGCIIRAGLLEDIMKAYDADTNLVNIMMDNGMSSKLSEAMPGFTQFLSAALHSRVPVPAFSAAFNYYTSYHSAWLPANLVQAQRDFFGAHTFERNDRDGVFHNIWNETIQ
ncbi:MAG: NADP-dependent phosphogluconate dehydrogenase [Ferruginibacter sp.]